jgi:hypothetical protein
MTGQSGRTTPPTVGVRLDQVERQDERTAATSRRAITARDGGTSGSRALGTAVGGVEGRWVFFKVMVQVDA